MLLVTCSFIGEDGTSAELVTSEGLILALERESDVLAAGGLCV